MFLLTDYRGQFYSSTRARGAAFDLDSLRAALNRLGYDTIILRYADLNLRVQDFAGEHVLYQSSEDPGLLYKEYIEDLLLGLKMQGANLIPDFEYFRAHHNKTFMEVLRDVALPAEIGGRHSQSFGTLEDFMSRRNEVKLPAVIKPSAGSKGHGVAIAKDASSLLRRAKRLARSNSLHNLWWRGLHLFDARGFLRMSNHRRKFLVQEYVPTLRGDYKVVIYWDRYFVLYRHNRSGSPTASGSGRLSRPYPPQMVLDFAESVMRSFSTPFMALDIGHTFDRCHLFEFQFVCFGQRTVEDAQCYYERQGGHWAQVSSQPVVEQEFARSVDLYVRKAG
jgi:glutathione synthase/RimK-type ligase-like ATP-grasp enzyme